MNGLFPHIQNHYQFQELVSLCESNKIHWHLSPVEDKSVVLTISKNPEMNEFKGLVYQIYPEDIDNDHLNLICEVATNYILNKMLNQG